LEYGLLEGQGRRAILLSLIKMGIYRLCTNYGAQDLVLSVGDKKEGKALVFKKIIAFALLKSVITC